MTETTMSTRTASEPMEAFDGRAWIRPGCVWKGWPSSLRGWPASWRSGCRGTCSRCCCWCPTCPRLGYLRGPRLGAIIYNVVHDLCTGAAVLGVGLALGSRAGLAVGAVLIAHIGMDRAPATA